MKLFYFYYCVIGIFYFFGYIKGDESEECKCTSWNQWSGYGGCTKHCGGGLQYRSRSRACDSTVIFDDGSFILCPVNETFPRFCNTQPCGCDDICSSWSPWSNSTCSVRCGGGTLINTRTRSCAQSPGCSEKDETSQTCNTQECTGCNCLDWANWSDYGYCSATCGVGVQRRSRNRSCFPINNDDCTGATTEIDTIQCSHGLCCDETCTEWSEWDSSTCSAACDHGWHIRTRNRVCSLEDCYYIEKVNSSCKIRTCENTCQKECGQWSGWLNGACSDSCGGGISIHSRTRQCPTAVNDCVDDILRVPCNTQSCPKPLTCDEGCTTWSDWKETSCSASCDIGTATKTRSRSCNITNCDLEDFESFTCKQKTCEATCNETCSSWELVTNRSCSTSCDYGNRVQVWNRTCTHSDCLTSLETTETCRESICKETCDIKCTPWDSWFDDSCTVTCGGGNYVRQRLRGCPEEFQDCPLSETKHISCNNNTCPDTCDSRCTTWGEWVDSNCSTECDGGKRIRQRLRGCPIDIDDCLLLEVTETLCNTHICPETCNTNCFSWSNWAESPCSVSCDGGILTRHRSRACPTEFSTDCPLTDTAKVTCNNQTCKDTCDKTCSDWSVWNYDGCTVTCGGGQKMKSRSRSCRIPDCDRTESIFEECNTLSCTDRIEDKLMPDCKGSNRQFYPHPLTCKKFYHCVWGQPHEMECPSGTAWDDTIQGCDHTWKIPSCNGKP